MYTIVITVSLSSVIHSSFVLWLWYKILYRQNNNLMMLDYEQIPTAPPMAQKDM